MRRALARLRWQLTLSHLVAVAFTLVSMIAAAILIATFIGGLRGGPAREPAQGARAVAQAVRGVIAGGDPVALNAILRALARGQLALAPWGPSLAPEARARWMGFALRDVAYIVALAPDGRPLGSSDPAGAAFAPPEREEWRALAAAAASGDRTVIRAGTGPVAYGVAPVVDEQGRPAATVVVALAALAPARGMLSPWWALAIFGAATVAILAAASVFALASSSLLAYLLARRLVARLERLGAAAEALAAGDLARRVEEGPADEVGQLARRFNHMAADLERILRELRAERDRVAGLLEARRQLVASISHELRTPVATIRGYLDSMLRRGAAPAHLRPELESMEREVGRLQRLIDDLFTVARASVGRLTLRLEPTDAGAVVRRLVETVAPLAWGQRRVQVLSEVGPDPPRARADAERLEQIVSNLLGNAVRHTPPGGLVVASVTGEPDAVRVEVRDTGEGIAPEDLPHVFERFYRGHGREGGVSEEERATRGTATTPALAPHCSPLTPQRHGGGAGLGLALARELAEAMGGTVEAASQPGEGSRFTLRLPRA